MTGPPLGQGYIFLILPASDCQAAFKFFQAVFKFDDFFLREAHGSHSWLIVILCSCGKLVVVLTVPDTFFK